MKKENIDLLNDFIFNAKVVDLSTVFENGMPKFPTHPPIVINPTIVHEIDGYYCQTIFMPEHIGSHVDAPYHIHSELKGQTIDAMDPLHLIGRAIIIDLTYLDLKPGDLAPLKCIKEFENKNELKIKKDDIVLINFGRLKRVSESKDPIRAIKDYTKNAPGLSKEIAEYLLLKKIKAIGSDTIACGTPMVDGKPSFCWIHELLLKNNILIMECINNLEKIPCSVFFIALPLKIKNGSGSPIRPIALI